MTERFARSKAVPVGWNPTWSTTPTHNKQSATRIDATTPPPEHRAFKISSYIARCALKSAVEIARRTRNLKGMRANSDFEAKQSEEQKV